MCDYVLNIKYLDNYNIKQWGELSFKNGNSAIDLRAAIDKQIRIRPGERVVIPTGISVEVTANRSLFSDIANDYSKLIKEYEDSVELQVRPRSGLAARQGLVNIIGTIDSSYRGEIGAIVYNLNQALIPVFKDTTEDSDFEIYYNKDAEVVINPGDRIAQLVISNIIKPQIYSVNKLSESERGKNGFGSTGVK